jgi:hypothetical protein
VQDWTWPSGDLQLDFSGGSISSRTEMYVDPISAANIRTAQNAIERLREYAELAERRILYHANYLRDLGERVRQMEIERAKSAELFDTFRRNP